jgi:hypothetical protein
LADGYADEQQALDRILPWLTKIAPRKVRVLAAAIEKHVPEKMQKSVVRRYIMEAQRLMNSPDAQPEVVHLVLDRAIRNVRTLFKRDDPIWRD